MLTLLFIACMFCVFGKLMVFGLKATWGFAKLLVTLVFLPITLILMVLGGLMSLAFPILIIIGIGALLVRD